MEDKKLYLSNTDKKMLGVCGGIAEYLGVDSTVVRAIFAVLFFAFGTGLLAYFVLYFIMPKRNDHFISD
ncbi:MAG: PspC domain-containing protein [Erysipelothrix sp.]|nr:PspC domain-containing protein [Erysipelothrix sp.]